MPANHVYECESCHECFSIPDPLPKPAKDYNPTCPKCGSKNTTLAYSMPEKASRRPNAGGSCCGGGKCC